MYVNVPTFFPTCKFPFFLILTYKFVDGNVYKKSEMFADIALTSFYLGSLILHQYVSYGRKLRNWSKQLTKKNQLDVVGWTYENNLKAMN